MAGDGRNTNFAGGASYARTVQTGAGRGGYRARSVLDPLARSGTGYSTTDRSRMLADGSMLRSMNGSSESTYTRQTWMASPYHPAA